MSTIYNFRPLVSLRSHTCPTHIITPSFFATMRTKDSQYRSKLLRNNDLWSQCNVDLFDLAWRKPFEYLKMVVFWIETPRSLIEPKDSHLPAHRNGNLKSYSPVLFVRIWMLLFVYYSSGLELWRFFHLCRMFTKTCYPAGPMFSSPIVAKTLYHDHSCLVDSIYLHILCQMSHKDCICFDWSYVDTISWIYNL